MSIVNEQKRKSTIFLNEIDELNQIGKLENNSWTPYRKLSELTVDKPYVITKISIVNGKYGRNIVAELEECKINLPNRFNKVLTEDKLQLLNSKKNFFSFILYILPLFFCIFPSIFLLYLV